jgi:hypothetical protein
MYSPKFQQNSYQNYDEDDSTNNEEIGSIVSDMLSPYVDQINHNRRTNIKPLKESFTFESQMPQNNDNDDDSMNYEETEDYYSDDGDDENINKKLVNVAGHYFSLKYFNKNLRPLLKANDKIDLIDCTIGSRQPNETDCNKYYVCNPENKHVVSYTCPMFTAFNKNTRICDRATHKVCNSKRLTLGKEDENKRIHMETLEALQQAKAEALKAQKIANMIRRQSQLILANKRKVHQQSQEISAVREQNIETHEPLPTPKPPKRRKQSSKIKKKKARCREPGKIADPESSENYYLCFLDQENKSLQQKKIACSTGLLYCPQTKYCTLKSKCRRN